MVHFESGGFGGAIGQDNRRIIQEYRVPHCGLDADTRRASCENWAAVGFRRFLWRLFPDVNKTVLLISSSRGQFDSFEDQGGFAFRLEFDTPTFYFHRRAGFLFGHVIDNLRSIRGVVADVEQSGLAVLGRRESVRSSD